MDGLFGLLSKYAYIPYLKLCTYILCHDIYLLHHCRYTRCVRTWVLVLSLEGSISVMMSGWSDCRDMELHVQQDWVCLAQLIGRLVDMGNTISALNIWYHSIDVLPQESFWKNGLLGPFYTHEIPILFTVWLGCGTLVPPWT